MTNQPQTHWYAPTDESRSPLEQVADALRYKAEQEAMAVYLKDGETPAACVARNRADIDRLMTMLAREKRRSEHLERLLRNLHALVRGECPSLLNEDSGGDAALDGLIRDALAPPCPFCAAGDGPHSLAHEGQP